MKENFAQKLDSESSNAVEQKSTFLAKIRRSADRRLQALAVAGFLTFGFSSESQADQVKFVRPENISAHFILEGEVSAEKLQSFKEKIKIEEPEFFKWVEEYISTAQKEIDKMAMQINNFDEGKDRPEEEQFQAESKGLKIQNLNPGDLVKQNHKALENLRSHKDFPKAIQMLWDNVENVLWRFILLDDSSAVRNSLRENVAAPKVDFKYHQRFELDRSLAITIVRPSEEGKKLLAEIKLSPQSFIGQDGRIDLNLFINTFFHELYHALHPGSQKQEPGLMTGFQQNMIEGLAQNATFEVMQSLARGKNIKGLRPEIGMNNYDELVVVASITDAIIRSSLEPDLLARWNVGLITEEEFFLTYKRMLPRIGLDPGLADDLAKLSSRERDPELYSPVAKVYENMLARLKISGYALSPKFVESILTSGRIADAVQKENIKYNLKLGKLDNNVSSRVNRIKNNR